MGLENRKPNMGIPLKITPKKLDDYLEVMSKAVFQAGLSWSSIDKRWTSFVNAFSGFDPKKVAKLSDAKIQSLIDNQSLLLNQKKLEATVHNANMLITLDKEYSGFANYLRAFNKYESLALDLKKRFKYFGDLNVYYFLFRVGEPVPQFEKWIKTIEGDHPRMKEMIEADKIENKNEFGDAINKHRD
jgi:hypothetical protein